MTTFVDDIWKFNHLANLLDQPLDDYREASYLIEEALEGFNIAQLAAIVNAKSASPKDSARAIVDICRNDDSTMYPATIAPVDRLDKACDSVIFAIGYMAKQGLSPSQIERAISAVMSANLAKLFMPRDAYGKLTKPADFVGPEAELQLILEE